MVIRERLHWNTMVKKQMQKKENLSESSRRKKQQIPKTMRISRQTVFQQRRIPRRCKGCPMYWRSWRYFKGFSVYCLLRSNPFFSKKRADAICRLPLKWRCILAKYLCWSDRRREIKAKKQYHEQMFLNT